METVSHVWILYNLVFVWITVVCFWRLPRMAETWSLAWVPGRMVPQAGLTLITMPQGLCGLASHSHYRSTAKRLFSFHIPLPALSPLPLLTLTQHWAVVGSISYQRLASVFSALTQLQFHFSAAQLDDEVIQWCHRFADRQHTDTYLECYRHSLAWSNAATRCLFQVDSDLFPKH